MTARVELVIDEVVVHGIGSSDSHVVIAALETELEQLATSWVATGAPLGPRAEASRHVEGVVGDPTPSELGSGLAAAVWQAVTGGVR